MKSISKIINEEFEKFIIKEFMQPSFSWDTFKHLQYPIERIKYCEKHLGERIGNGTSRAVFDYDDEKVLKISKRIDTEQNEQEVEVCMSEENNMLLPKVFDFDKKNNFTWILAERVLAATEEDFERIMGISFYDPEERFEKQKERAPHGVGFDEYHSDSPMDNRWEKPEETQEDDFDFNEDNVSMKGFLEWCQDYIHGWQFDDEVSKSYEQWAKLPWFKDLMKLFKYQEPYEFRLDNFGIALRNGKPCIVVLDIGYSG